MLWLLELALPAVFASAPTYSYWHVHVDARGITKQVQCVLKDFELKGVTDGVTPQWLNPMNKNVQKLTITTQPVGWVGAWHENPGPQWIIPLRGKWFVETSDGVRTVMGPGDISLGEDQSSVKDSKGHRGHLSGTVGDEPATLMIVSLGDAPTKNQPCHQR